MGGLVDLVFGGNDDTSNAVIQSNRETNQQITANTDKQIKFLRESRLLSGGGLSSSIQNGKLTVTPSANRTALVRSLSNVLVNTSKKFGKLGSQIRPGFSELRRVGLTNLQGERQRVVGSLKDNLARRRISGSSFASDAVSRAEAEFQKREDEFTAQTFLQEIDASAQLIQSESTALQASIETQLLELNLETGLAAELTGLANNAIAALTGAQTSALSSLASNNSSALIQAGKEENQFFGKLLFGA